MFAPNLNIAIMKNMPILLIYVVILLGLSAKSFGQSGKQIFTEPLSPRNANYDIDVKLFTSTKMLEGKETIKWTNSTSKPTNELQFHLYLNGFSNNKSTILLDSEGINREGKSFKEANSSFIKINAIKIDNVNFFDKLSANAIALK